MDTTTRREQNDVAPPDEPERCDRRDTPTAEDDTHTESLFDGGVFRLPPYTIRGVGE